MRRVLRPVAHSEEPALVLRLALNNSLRGSPLSRAVKAQALVRLSFQ
jgi:hypothetical protein